MELEGLQNIFIPHGMTLCHRTSSCRRDLGTFQVWKGTKHSPAHPEPVKIPKIMDRNHRKTLDFDAQWFNEKGGSKISQWGWKTPGEILLEHGKNCSRAVHSTGVTPGFSQRGKVTQPHPTFGQPGIMDRMILRSSLAGATGKKRVRKIKGIYIKVWD